MIPKTAEQPQADQTSEVRDLLDSVRDQFSDLDDRMKKVLEATDDAAASLRMEIHQNRREMAEVKVHLTRLQGRVDTQLMTLVIANLASGVGVAALMLGAARAF